MAISKILFVVACTSSNKLNIPTHPQNINNSDDIVERKASVKRQVSWGPPTVAEVEADTVKVKKITKQNGYYNGNNNTSNATNISGNHIKSN